MEKKPVSPKATPIATLAREIVFTYFQSEHGMAKMARIMRNAKSKGLVKTPKQFRKWMITEISKTVDTIDIWLEKHSN
jgi:hypothetical protein